VRGCEASYSFREQVAGKSEADTLLLFTSTSTPQVERPSTLSGCSEASLYCLFVSNLCSLSMPTLVSELSSHQSMWLYDNQLTRGDSYEDKWNHRMDPTFDTTIFRNRPQKRQAPYEEDFAVKARRTDFSTERTITSAAAKSSTGPRYPHSGEKLTWAQSKENLKVYYDHYGVSAAIDRTLVGERCNCANVWCSSSVCRRQ
jgi:hypothetical protein